jgi:hypothetical protein
LSGASRNWRDLPRLSSPFIAGYFLNLSLADTQSCLDALRRARVLNLAEAWSSWLAMSLFPQLYVSDKHISTPSISIMKLTLLAVARSPVCNYSIL